MGDRDGMAETTLGRPGTAGCDSCGGVLQAMPELQSHGCHECASCGLVVCLPFPDDICAQYGADYFDRRREQDAAGIRAKLDSFRPLAADLKRALGEGAK